MKQVTPATLAAALQTLWRMRKGNGSFVWDLPVPPDEQTAKALYAALPDQPDALRLALDALTTVLKVHDSARDLEYREGFPGMFPVDGTGELAALEGIGYTIVPLATSAAAGEGGEG